MLKEPGTMETKKNSKLNLVGDWSQNEGTQVQLKEILNIRG